MSRLEALVRWDHYDEQLDYNDLGLRVVVVRITGEGTVKKVLITLSAVAILMLLVACGETGVPSSDSTEESDSAAPAAESVTEPAEPEGAEEPVAQEPAAPALTMGQQQAVGKGEDYLSFAAFSRQGLIDQLVYEGFSVEDATFAVDYIAPDWNAQAAKKAQDYLDMTSFSRQGLIDQLTYEGFSQAEAEYGVTAVGY